MNRLRAELSGFAPAVQQAKAAAARSRLGRCFRFARWPGRGSETIKERLRRPGLPHDVAALGAAFALLAPSAPSLGADAALSEALRARVATLHAQADAPIGAGSAEARRLIAQLYEQRDFAALWSDPQRAERLLAVLRASATHGLDPRDYHVEPPAAGRADDARQRAERELLLTDAFMRLAYSLRFGKVDPRALDAGWNFSREPARPGPAARLSELIEAPDPAAALEALAPRLPSYAALRAALARLRDLERAGGWGTVAAGPKLELDAGGPRVAQLRARLRAGGDLDDEAARDDTGAARFDAALDAAVRRFQARHGLEVDGIVGPATLAALNVPVKARIDQVRANLERLRWVAGDLAGDVLVVDIAGFGAQLWLDGALAWSARAVVGRRSRTTPMFRARMQYLVLNPEWNVPPTILREDVLPKVARDPRYLQKHRMRVTDAEGRAIDAAGVDWVRYAKAPRGFPYQIVQPPGPDNPLGRIKFMFPNPHFVYLHDTPARELFACAVRAFSSGCIRVDKAFDLALLLLDDPQHWSAEQLRAAIDAGRTRNVDVRRQVPVLLLYFTAAVADGTLQFRPDLYDRDARVIRALAGPFRYAPLESARTDGN